MRIALLGHGTVGSGVYELVMKNKFRFKEEYGMDMNIELILVNNLDNYVHLPYKKIFTNRFQDFKDLSIDVAIETIGGIEPAFKYVSHFLSKGIPVITSNKDLIAEKGSILSALAIENNTHLCYEASVGGGIPILRPLSENLGGDRIIEIAGIVNGTTNFILTKMTNESLSYSNALRMAQDLGFAESDPTSDVEGIDSVRKIAILTKIGLKVDIDWKTIPVVGITKIDNEDMAFFKKEFLTPKLLGISKFTQEGVYIAVRPVLLKQSSKFASIENEFNMVRVLGESVGELYFIGRGAGKMATATSILGDLVDLILNTKIKINSKLEKKDLQKLFPEKSKWILKLTGTPSDELKKWTYSIFSNKIQMHTAEPENTFFFNLIDLDEETLVKKLNDLSAHLTYDYKYYLIYE